MASTEEGADAMDIEVSPKNRTSVEHDIHQSLGSISNSVESLEMRADPDAQATVTDFLDFTEYLPSDMTRSLTLIGKLDQTYTEASINVHNLTSTWGKLPSIPAEERPSPVQLRADISDSLNHAVSSRVYAHAEAVRMSENVNRHYNRANTILAKLKNLLENYPAEEQKSPVATSKSQLVRAPRVMRNGDGEKVRRPRIPRITVPGEVLPPYDQFMAYSDDSDESSEEEDDDSLGRTPARTTPAPRIKVVKTPKARPPKTPKAASSARPPKSAAGQAAAATPAVVLQPPPENAVIGSADAPWLQLTPWELARLRKRMKKNATWSPSDTMILRELKTLGRGIDAYKEAKKKAEDEGRVFDQVPAALAPDAEAGNKPIPEGAISAAALASDDIQLSNRGMKLNEAKKLKRESLAKQAAEEAEESARQFREAARLLMSHEASSSSAANNTNTTTTTTNNNNNTTTPSTANNTTTNTTADQPKGVSKAKTPAKPKPNGNKRKRDSIPEAEAEKPEQPPVETPAPRPAPKRTKTETPVPLPHLRASLAAQPLTESTIPPPVLTPGGTAVTPKMTTPVPIPVPGQDGSTTTGTGPAAAKPANTSAPASSPTGSVGPPASVASNAPASILTKLPAETPIPPPILSPKKSTTPILPPVRDSAARRETRGEMAKKNQQQLDNPTPVPAPQVPQAQRSSSAAPSIKQSSSRAATPGTTPVPDGQGRRPSSRGKAMSQEPQPSLATDRPRRASTARNTPAPEQRQQSKRTRKPVPGIVSKTNAGGSSAVGKRKAAPKKKRAQKKEKGQPIEIELEEDDEGNPIDPKEPRYCDCNRVSFGEMIACDNENCDKEWFHLECMGMTHIPARTTKWYCPDCRLRLNIGEKGEINARGVKKSLAQWATDHLKKHKRPLRIAVDAAHWQFKNVSDAQEAAIQQRSHPKEKAILERLLPLMRLGIHVVFVFDGEKRPQIKRGSKRYGQRESTTALIKNTLGHILVPWLQAPGEAEAECALLQQQGLVDAVWSEDGDCFMFGSTVVIRDLRDTKNHKSKEHARIFDMRDIRRLKAGLYNDKSVACFAMLTGSDYAPSGLLGCRTCLAQELVKDGGLVESFYRIQSLPQRNQWRTRLRDSIEKITSLTDLHFNKDKSNIMTFPDLEALKNCRSPAVSTSDTLKRLPFLQGEWYGTHTTNSLATTIPWMQQYYFSRMTTIWWIRQFTPMVLNQRLLKGEVQALDLVAKVAQKRKERPTSSIELDPCNVFPGIENVFIESEGNLLVNRLRSDRELAGSPIENGKFDMLDAILGLGMSDKTYQKWRKKKSYGRTCGALSRRGSTGSRVRSAPLPRRVCTSCSRGGFGGRGWMVLRTSSAGRVAQTG
ncbi:PHD-finger domain-containing protein [Colletotrichum scovillei]|uniref:PHD-finger domain-containing protein n=1 Tax=Colletotrichum scovillei TaxID=1209932 RepID=UPI0015C3A244|nr:PHD-finger domain-containing protein [Colletotrichum scovillei]KAF4783719.1 PHD-finger domain-containing protein [Colletotrichum scovillei]